MKQLIQSILNLLQSPNPDLGKLASLLQQFYSALASFFYTLIIDPATLQLLFNLLTQLIGATPGAGPTGTTGARQDQQGPPTGVTGATGATGGIITTAGYFYSTDISAKAVNATLPLEQPPVIVGTGPSFH